jgi:ABC-type Fe3+/spermidine/putrescine transport system ATPase subunit
MSARRGGRVELVDLVKRFGEVTAVDGISLDIPAGEFFSLLGPSGCGKTTTLRMIGGSSGRTPAGSSSTAGTWPRRRPTAVR